MNTKVEDLLKELTNSIQRDAQESTNQDLEINVDKLIRVASFLLYAVTTQRDVTSTLHDITSILE